LNYGDLSDLSRDGYRIQWPPKKQPAKFAIANYRQFGHSA
jgi:hypothetical protein